MCCKILFGYQYHLIVIYTYFYICYGRLEIIYLILLKENTLR